jgi:periplasmic glucans biosynthesis protein
MAELTRRKLAKFLLANSLIARGFATSGALAITGGKLLAQTVPSTGQSLPTFGYDDVVKRARQLSTVPFDSTLPPLPEVFNNLDFDAWRDIKFRPERAFLNHPGSLFRLQLFHLGYLYHRPVTVNTIRDGIPTPIPYANYLFDYHRTHIEGPLPVNLGFAGFRLYFQLNNPTIFDEVIAFLGSQLFPLSRLQPALRPVGPRARS